MHVQSFNERTLHTSFWGCQSVAINMILAFERPSFMMHVMEWILEAEFGNNLSAGGNRNNVQSVSMINLTTGTVHEPLANRTSHAHRMMICSPQLARSKHPPL